MKYSEQFAQRFRAEKFEPIEFLDEFLQWHQNSNQKQLVRLPAYFEKIQWSLIRYLLIMAFLASIIAQIFMSYVLALPITPGTFIFGFACGFTATYFLRVGNNIRVRRKFVENIKEILDTVVPLSNSVTYTRELRIHKVSRWFVPVRQFMSRIPGKEGLVVVVLSPTEPQLFFVRDILE